VVAIVGAQAGGFLAQLALEPDRGGEGENEAEAPDGVEFVDRHRAVFASLLHNSSNRRQALLQQYPLGIGVNQLQRPFAGGARLAAAPDTSQ
jgi:hypothetical protein